MGLITIQVQSGIPKYKQIIISVELAIREGKLLKGGKLPSVNKVCLEFSLSRDTVLLAYDELKKRGILFAIPGKGYYVKSTEISIQKKIFVLFDELNIFKEDLYNAFLQKIGKEIQVDIFFHHFNEAVFRKLVQDSNGNYTQYVIMPCYLPEAADIISILPEQEVYILDQTNPGLRQYPAVYQNFVSDMYDGLAKALSQLKKYGKLILIFPGFREPPGMLEGFRKFCKETGMPNEVIAEFDNRSIRAGEVYIIPNDRDLVKVIEQAKKQQFEAGKDFGTISYNETPLKKVVGQGITTISTDFEAMGEIMARMILKGERKQVENRSGLILRKSL